MSEPSSHRTARTRRAPPPEDLRHLDDRQLQERIDAIDREIARISAERGNLDNISVSERSEHRSHSARESASRHLSNSRVNDWLLSQGRGVDADQGENRAVQGSATAAVLSAGSNSGRAPTRRPDDRPVQPRTNVVKAETAAVGQETGMKRTLATIKLGTYDGSTPLETHLAKLENCSEYYHWSKRDRLCHLKASLDGHAGQVLWGLGSDASEDDVIKLLRNRFGNVNQMERFRAELGTRRRKPGESIQAVYQDIRRLLALGFPGQSGELCEIIGRDAFLEALADPKLRIRVLDQQPATLEIGRAHV